MTKILALSGGVGGAKLALGLSHVLPPQNLQVVVNTADDFEHLGLSISPDLDTLMYTLACRNNVEQGWGLADESWNAFAMLREFGAEDWFQLGDKDIATHILRTNGLRQGKPLSEITAQLSAALGVEQKLIPMSDDPVRTKVITAQGELSFQEYFVRERCQPTVERVFFEGLERALPQADFFDALASSDLDCIVICPSNPFVSVAPILALKGVKQALQKASVPVIAVAPIVGGRAIKGPTAKMMQELDLAVSAKSVAAIYCDLIDGFILDQEDTSLCGDIEQMGLQVHCCSTVMHTLNDRISLAKSVLSFAKKLSKDKL